MLLAEEVINKGEGSMPVKKSGLGKGLDSLIPNKNVKSAKPSVKAEEKAAPKENEAGIMVKIK